MTNEKGVIRFETNKYEELAFTHAVGVLSEGNYGDQWYRRTTDGRQVYLSQAVESRLLDLEIQPGERIQIGKIEVQKGRSKKIQWDVRRVDPKHELPGQPSEPSKVNPAAGTPVQVNVQKQPNTPVRIPPQRAQPAPPPPAQTTSTAVKPDPFIEPAPKPVLHTQASNILKACLMAAIDAARDAQTYAANAGFPLVFGPDQVEAMAISLYIQLSKQSNINLMNRNQEVRENGGANPWQHQ